MGEYVLEIMFALLLLKSKRSLDLRLDLVKEKCVKIWLKFR